MLIHKTLSLNSVALKMDGEAEGTFSGYASVFGGVDSYGDTIVKGAFKKTLAKGMPKMFFNHNWDMPVGKWLSAEEDDKGLFVRGQLTPDLSLAKEVRAAMRHETLDGLSIGGYLRRGDYEEDDEGNRKITNWSELVEVSPVVFPADQAARIDAGSVKSAELLSAIDEVESIRDLERFLRDAGSFSKGAAVALVARAKKILTVAGDPDQSELDAKAAAELQARMARLISLSANR